MNKYNTEEYFSVIDKNTGRKIVDCAEWSDAMMMFDFDPQNRTITRNKFLMGQVIDVEMPKSLPTNEISINTKPYQEHQDEWISEQIKKYDRMVEKMNQLPDRQEEPFIV